MKNRLIARVVTDEQLSVTITDWDKFEAGFAEFRQQAPHKNPHRKHFLAAIAARFFRGEIEGREIAGCNIYTGPYDKKMSARFGENIEFKD